MKNIKFPGVVTGFATIVLFVCLVSLQVRGQGLGVGDASNAKPADVQEFKDILAKKGIRFGTFVLKPDAQQKPPRPSNYLETISQYYNFYQMTVTWGAIEGYHKDVYDFRTADATCEFAMAHNAKVKAHVLILGDRGLPKWLMTGNFNPDELRTIEEEHIKTIIKHFRDKYPGLVTEWNVVNEVVCNGGVMTDPRDTCYPEGIKKFIWSNVHKPGSTDPTDYIQYAFEWAHEADPDAKLFLNDDGIEQISGQYKKDRLYNLVKSLKDKGVPIDGVGFECHGRLGLRNDYSVKSLVAELNRYADLGLETEISETDVMMDSGIQHVDHPPFYIEAPIENPTEQDFKDQAAIFRIFLTACLTAKNCKAFVTMCTSDNASWTSDFYPGQFYAHLLDTNMQPKFVFKTLIETAKEYDRKHH